MSSPQAATSLYLTQLTDDLRVNPNRDECSISQPLSTLVDQGPKAIPIQRLQSVFSV